VGLWRSAATGGSAPPGGGKLFGIIARQHQRYLAGADITTDEHDRLVDVDWFNELFERVDPAKKKRRTDAQVHKFR
jgi:hypothetical protein